MEKSKHLMMISTKMSFATFNVGETYQAALDLLLKGVHPSKKKRGKINSAMKDRVSELTCKYLSLRLNQLENMTEKLFSVKRWNHDVASFLKEIVGYYREVIQVRLPELEKLDAAAAEAAVKLRPGSVFETEVCDELMRSLAIWKAKRFVQRELEPLK